MNESQNQPTKVELQQFVDNNFEVEGLEFDPWNPSDWISDPPFLARINNTELRDWAQKLHEGWKSLGRQVKGDWRQSNSNIIFLLYNTVYNNFCQSMFEIIRNSTLLYTYQTRLSFPVVDFENFTTGILIGSCKDFYCPK